MKQVLPYRTWLGGALALLLVLTAMLAGPIPAAHALDRRSSETIVVPAGETIDDDLLASGRLVRIDGIVRGDVYAFAQHVTVTGTIEGDLIAAAQEVVIDGRVEGNVRAAGALVQVNGAVDRNVTSAGQLLQLGTGGRVAGNWISAAETLSIGGDVGGALTAAGSDVIVQGRIGRHAELALDSLTFGPNARIGGGLTYHADHELDVPAGAVAGPVSFRQAERPAARHREPPAAQTTAAAIRGAIRGALGNLFSLAWLAGSAIAGLALLRLFPRFVARFLAVVEAQPLPSLGIGFVSLIATLPAAVLVAITVIGIPLAALLAAAYFSGLFFGWLLLAVALGTILVGLAVRGRESPRRYPGWAFVLGLLVLYVATRVPWIGGLVWLAGMSLGLGALLIALYHVWRGGAATKPAMAADIAASPTAVA